MGQFLHGNASMTEAVRRAIQLRQKSVRALAKHYGISPTTVQKWRKRSSVADAPTGPKEPCSTVLTTEEEAIVVAFRRHTLLPLDDCLYGLQPTIPHLSRSSLHRCLQQHGISRLPEVEGASRRPSALQTTPLAPFISTLPTSGPKRANYTFSWPLTELRSSLSPSLRRKATATQPANFYAP